MSTFKAPLYLGTPTMSFHQNPLVTIKIQNEDLKFRKMSV